MNKQEALEQLKWLRYKHLLISRDKDFTEPLDMAISSLEQQLTNGWIPVSEPPSEYGTYMVAWRPIDMTETENIEIVEVD